MAELYNYLLVAYKFLVGLVASNPKRLIFIAVMAVAFYLVWIAVALYLSFQRKFSKNCVKLYDFVKTSNLDSTNLQVVDLKTEKISHGFYHGWKKFKSNPNSKPSDYITRREALDVEVTGGVLNQGKTFMKAFITITSLVLFLFNFAYLGADKTLTSELIAESLVFPLVYFAVMKLFYFMYTSIKQQLYKQDIECFYDLIDLLDETFGSKQAAPNFANVSYIPQNATVIPSDDEVVAFENGEELTEEQTAENAEEAEAPVAAEQEEVDENPLKSLDKYDIFKKKNIDVDKIINEVPKNAGTSLPYINVDSDYVIKDDENRETAKIVTDEDSATSILGGMMQDRASLKKNNENFLDVEKQVAEIDQEKIAEANAPAEEKVEEAKPAADADPFSAFDKFEVAENAEPETPAEPAVTPEPAPVEEKVEQPAPEPVPEPTPEPAATPEPAPVVETPSDDVSDQDKESIAIAVSGFKTNRSKLASGGVVIERNEPIARRERPVVYEQPEPEPEVVPEPEPVQEIYPRHDEIQQLNINENTDSILNSIKTSAGGYDAYGAYADPYANQGYGQGYGYGAPQQPYAPTGYSNPYGGAQMNNFGGYQNQGFSSSYAGEINQNPYNQNFDTYEEDEDVEDVYEEEVEEEVVETQKPAKKKRTKEEEPRPRNLRKKAETKVEETQAPAKTRGRPKKQEVSETMTIKSDKEFDEVLSRAEKLMRKSEEGLSASQSKRIEKELKMLMDAMNRYKENK